VDLLRLVSDGYERKARLYPGLLLILPLVVTIVAIWSAKLSVLQSLAAVVAGCGGSFLLAQLARDAGKKREEALFASWGGMPSVAIFRHQDTRIDPITKARYHKTLGSLVKNAKPPSPQEEAANPNDADKIYRAWSTYLRSNTHDNKKYPLLFAENVSYGYRRNLYGLRPWGITISSLSFAAASSYCVWTYLAAHEVPVELAAAAIVAVVLLLLWTLRFTASWARVPGEAYAQRLAETVDIITRKQTRAK
jgi:Flp pilus assembly protein TadB